MGNGLQMRSAVRFSPPVIGEAEIEAVVETLRSGWLTTGPKTLEFETAFAKRIGCQNAVAVSSCTAGLTLALAALGIKPGDRVATSVMTFTATLEAICAVGAEPVLVDVHPGTLNMDPDALEILTSSDRRIKAVIPVHYAGQACRMDQIEKICRPRGIAIVEDAAHAFPSRFEDRLIGTIGDATVFSFYANKTLTTGEGGMVATEDVKLATKMRRMRLHGIQKPTPAGPIESRLSWQYDVLEKGHKCNLHDIASAIGMAQLAKADVFHKRRMEIAMMYMDLLGGLPLDLPVLSGPISDHSWHLFVIQVHQTGASLGRNELSARMLESGIETSVHFKPVHLHTYWSRMLGLGQGAFPVAERAYQSILSLPVHAMLSDHDVRRVAGSMRSLLTGAAC